jgi:DNA polymerase III subunit epsilon
MLPNLERPLIFFDLETTGVDIRDRIIELFAVKLHPDGSKTEIHHFFNPGVPIPAEATDVHGYTDEMVADKPPFASLVNELEDFFTGCDLAGYNIRRFDVPLLIEEFHRLRRYPIRVKDTRVLDPYVIFQRMERRDLTGAMKFYCASDLADAHSAKADVEATMEIFRAQLHRYPDLPSDVSALDSFIGEGFVGYDNKFKIDREGRVIFNFGKYFGKPVADHPDYLEWIYKESDMPISVRSVAGDLWKAVR